MKIDYTCRDCGHEFSVVVYPSIPARIFGPPETCHPAEGGELDPPECPECNADVDEEDVRNQAEAIENSLRERDDYDD